MFFNNFNKVGPGIPKDAPKKKGFALFFDILFREFWNIITANFLFIIYSIPVITIGASYAALNHVMMKMMRDEPIYVMQEFNRGFKNNFKQGTILGFGIFILSVLLFISYFFYSNINEYLGVFIAAISIILTMISNFIYPLVVSVNLTLKYVLKNAFLLSSIKMKSSLLSLFIGLFIFLSNFLFFPYTLFPILLISFSLGVFINMFIIYPTIEEHIIQR